MFTINGTLRLAEYTHLDHHVFQLKDNYLVKRVKREEKGLVICEASNTITKQEVDIQKFSNIFENNYGLSLLRQIQIYKAMMANKYIRSLEDIIIPTKLIYPRGEKEEEEIGFKDVYLVFESMKNFEDILGEGEEGQEVDLIKVKCKSYIWQVLTAVHHLHTAGIIHGNLTPLNLAVSPDRRLVQLYNFHLSAPEVPTEEELHDEKEECNQGYTAPGFFLGHTRYHTCADIWAIGCIFAQLLNGGTPLFSLSPETQPTVDNWLLHIIKMVKPTVEDLEYFEADFLLHLVSSSIEEKEEDDPLDQLTFGDDCSRDLLKSMLHFNPTKRITVEDALQHRYFSLENMDNIDEEDAALLEILEIQDEEQGLESKIKELARATSFREEGIIAPYKLNAGQLKDLIWKEMVEF